MTRAGLDYFLKENEEDITPAEALVLSKQDPSPRVEITGRSTKVTVLTFEMNRGYSLLKVYFQTPNVLLKFEDDVLVKNHTTTLF